MGCRMYLLWGGSRATTPLHRERSSAKGTAFGVRFSGVVSAETLCEIYFGKEGENEKSKDENN
ncbi:MAG: hypothetical protein APF77_11400 [Clostridia bacterium BRH_c25]|nr:MAG: hypothetical protein APF77_11400 [Clostridia bacterium BRH_c25]